MSIVIVLECSSDVVLQRIAQNTGGDRTRRTDDQPVAIERKLEIYRERTAPLVDFFRDNGAQLVQLSVTPTSTAEEMWSRLQATMPVVD